jgi:deoxycytidylate deaminase
MLIKFDKQGYLKILNLLDTCQKFSRCKRNGVCILGCEIIHDTLRVRGISINTPIIGKECTGEKGNCGCRHAEEDLLLQGQFELLICTHSPCIKCYVEFLNPAVIREFWYLNEYRTGVSHLKDSMFPIVRMKDYDTTEKRWNALRKYTRLTLS